MTIAELQERQIKAFEEAKSIAARAEAEKRDLTKEEQDDIDGFNREFEAVEADLTRLQKIEAAGSRLSQGVGRKTEPNPINNAVPQADGEQTSQVRNYSPQPDVRRDTQRCGFRNFGDFAQAVKNSTARGGTLDKRLEVMMATPSTYGSEGVGTDGGFAVPPDFRSAIAQKVMGEASLMSRTDQMMSSSNTIVLPKDETTPWQTSGGIQAYWGDEGALKTQSKPSLQESTIKLNKLYVLVPVTDELLEDAPGLDAYLRRKAPEKMDFKVNLAIVQGTGVGQPLGILGSAATVSVAKESGQAADTIVYANIVKMWSRLYAGSRQNAVWLVNQDVEPQLFAMAFNGDNNTPAYMPAGGLSGSPYSTLFGRPIIPTQACETLGDKGDIILADLSQYLTATKVGGIKSDVSIHLWFDYDITAFRFVMRVAGQPWWTTSISSRDGSNTIGHFVTLDERA